MIIPDYNIVSPDINELDASQCRLIIKTNGQFLQYIILHDSNNVDALRYYQLPQTSGKEPIEWMEEIFSADELLRKNWKEIIIIYAVPENQLVPEMLFDTMEKLLEFSGGDLTKEVVLTSKVANIPVQTVFRVSSALHGLLQNIFPAARYFHYFDWWMKEEEDGVHVVFYPNELMVKLISNGKSQLLQSYPYQVPEDVAYYLLTLYSLYNLSPDHIPLQVSGMIVNDSVLYEELLKYFKTVETVPPPASLALQPEFADYPSHFFSPVLKLAVCEL